MGCEEEEEAAILALCWEKHLLSGIWCHARLSHTDKVNWITGHPVSLSLITDSQGELKTSDTFRRFLPKDQTFIQMEMSLSSQFHCICEWRIWNSFGLNEEFSQLLLYCVL